MAVTLESTLRRPLESEDWQRRLLVGTLLVLTAAKLLPALLLAGFAFRVLRAGDDAPPGFADLRALAVEGVTVAGVALVYHVPAIAAFAATAGYARAVLGWVPGPTRGFGSLTAAPAASGFGVLAGAVVAAGVVFTVALAVAGTYLSTAAVLRYVHLRSPYAAFDLAHVLALASTRRFLATWLTVAAALALARLVAGLLGVVPLVGSVLAAAVTFYAAWVGLGHLTDRLPRSRVRTSARDGPGGATGS